MPILWRYLLGQYFKVLGLCVVAFITVLMITRLDVIAHFAALGPEFLLILKFTLYQVPYILPIAIPISCLISAILLIQRLSYSHELTAFRSCGFAVRDILTPLLIAAAVISLANFYIISELATHSHLSTGVLKKEMRKINPLLLLNNKHLMRLKGGYFETLGPSKLGEKAIDVVLALPNKNSSRINLMLAKKLRTRKDSLEGKGVSFVSAKSRPESFDDFAIENIGSMQTSIEDFSALAQKKVWKVKHDHLRLPLLAVRIQQGKINIQQARAAGTSKKELASLHKSLTCCYTEILRRISVAIAAFTFTLMGAAFGFNISRRRSNRGVFMVIVLAAVYLACFFTAKGLSHNITASSMLYLMPHMVIILLSIGMLKRITAGTE